MPIQIRKSKIVIKNHKICLKIPYLIWFFISKNGLDLKICSELFAIRMISRVTDLTEKQDL